MRRCWLRWGRCSRARIERRNIRRRSFWSSFRNRLVPTPRRRRFVLSVTCIRAVSVVVTEEEWRGRRTRKRRWREVGGNESASNGYGGGFHSCERKGRVGGRGGTRGRIVTEGLTRWIDYNSRRRGLSVMPFCRRRALRWRRSCSRLQR